ncbi:hypothetical protein QAD02_017304 [Eretmocerus hayati]|uniref:Uncharacterized protein n=1 Tax=Eretmocerus hayati TaxID=131215 RepID=A0ACC2PDI2_9HYME|nr:hypothetical protein QAD02_017304 [Eretmocerus hayati]
MDVVQEAMGSFGPWQLVIAIALSLVKFPVAWHQLSIVFLAPNSHFECVSPRAADDNVSMIDRCSVDAGNVSLPCTHFLYDRSVFRETIVTQWDLVCEREQLANLVQTATMFGILMGNMIFSAMSDRIGRKIPLMIAILLQSVSGLLTVFSPWYEMFLIFKFISALATGGTMLISFVLLMEIVGPKWRSSLSVLFHVPFILGYLSNPLIAYLTRTWSGFQMAVSIPPIFLLTYYWIIPESPRWLLAVGRTADAEVVLTKAAEKNRIALSKVSIAADSYRSKQKMCKEEKRYNISHLFRTPNLRVKTICICVNWFVISMCFFGLAQYISLLDGNIFTNTAVSDHYESCGTPSLAFDRNHHDELMCLVELIVITSCGADLLTDTSKLTQYHDWCILWSDSGKLTYECIQVIGTSTPLARRRFNGPSIFIIARSSEYVVKRY